MKKVVGQVSLVFLLVCSFSAFQSIGQTTQDTSNQVSRYIIPDINDTLSISKSGYYVSEILDLRANKSNNGAITIKGNKLPLVFKDSLPAFLSRFIFPNASTNPTLNTISIQIEKLKCFASTNGNIDDAQLYLKVNFYDINKGAVSHSFERTINYKKTSHPAFISSLIYTAFKAATSGLKNSKRAVNTYSSSNKPTNTKAVENELEEKKKRNIETIFHTIKYPNSKISWENTDYYLASIKDIRPYKANEGNVLLGIFNRSAEAKLDSSLEFYFQNSLNIDNGNTKTPLTLFVHTFHLIEEETAEGEKGSLMFSAHLVKDSAGKSLSIYKNTISVDSINEFDITKYWPSIISKALESYFAKFNLQPSKPFSIETASNPIVFSNNTDASQIIIKDTYNKTKYYKNGTRIKRLKEFDETFESIYNPEVFKTFSRAKVMTRVGRSLYVVAGALLLNSSIDYLYSEEKRLKNWYNNPKSDFLFDKKLEIWGGVGTLLTGIVLTTIGKSELLKAVRLHNKTVAEKVSIKISPDLYNQGFMFQLKFQLSQR